MENMLSTVTTALKAEQQIESCEHCHDAEIPFDWILSEVIAKRGPYEFMLTEPARCPNCKRPITDKTLSGTEGELAIRHVPDSGGKPSTQSQMFSVQVRNLPRVPF